MEPLKPLLREALKDEHEGLTDELIDRLEALMYQRFETDPDEEPEKLKQIDEERERLMQQYAPRYKEVCQRIEKQK